MKNSFARNRLGILLMLVSALCVGFGQLLWKLGTDGRIGLIAAGFVLYGTGAIVMVVAYRYGSLSVLQPVLSASYVLGLVLGFFFLGELITPVRLLGVLAITGGVILIAGGDVPARTAPDVAAGNRT